jgi:hypothetical protein
MQDFDTRDLLNDDEVEITDLDSPDDSSSSSLPTVLLRFARKTPLLANTRIKNTALALLGCAIVLLFLVQPGLPGRAETSIHSSLATSHTAVVQSAPSSIDGHRSRIVTWINISTGVVIINQASPGTIGWHYCKVQRRFTLTKSPHSTLVRCT